MILCYKFYKEHTTELGTFFPLKFNFRSVFSPLPAHDSKVRIIKGEKKKRKIIRAKARDLTANDTQAGCSCGYGTMQFPRTYPIQDPADINNKPGRMKGRDYSPFVYR